MSASICEIVSAEAVQQRLRESFGFDNMMPDSTETLRYVLSPENVATAGVTRITGRPSKVNPVKIIHDQRLLESDVLEGRGECTTDNPECDLVQTYNFDTTAAYNSAFFADPKELAGTTEENSGFIARKIQKHIAAVDQKMARLLAESIAAQKGGWSADTANIRGVNLSGNVLQVNDYIGTTGTPNPVLFQQIRRAMRLSRIEGGIVSGGSALVDFFERSFSRNGADSGWDVTEMLNRYGFAPVYDRFLAEELDSVDGSTNVAIGRGSVIPLAFCLFEDEYNKMRDSTNLADILYSPYTGAKYDFKINRACAEDPWSITVTGTMQFVTLPDYMYKSGDNLEGTKALASIEVSCTDLQPCQA
jgi:hypothetical protein